MFKDRNEALKRLEKALLAEDETMVFTPVQEPETVEAPEEVTEEGLLTDEALDYLLEDIAPGKATVEYQNFSNDYGNGYSVYNTDTTDTDLEEYCEQVLEPSKNAYTNLLLIAGCLTLGILLVLLYILLRYGGFL